MELTQFLKTSYTAFHAVKNAAALLEEAGFVPLSEREPWTLAEGGKYFVTRGGSSLIAFRYSKEGDFRVVASHVDSPCFKLKEAPALSDGTYTRLNAEPYGGGLWYTFFDRPLKLAGRIVREEKSALRTELFASEENFVLPSLAIHQNRDANEKFAPNLQTELPLFSLGKEEFSRLIGEALSFDLFAVPAEEPFFGGMNGEFLSSPRLDDLVCAFASVRALAETPACPGTALAVLFNSEEIGSRTLEGAGSDFLKRTLSRIAAAQGRDGERTAQSLASSLLLSADNAHALHPNHPEKCDPTNKPVLGGGVVIKGHAGGAYTSDALTAAIVKKIFADAGVKVQSFFNRSDARSGGTLGAISLGQVGVPSADIGIAQLAMHSAVETMARADFNELLRGLSAFFASSLLFSDLGVCVE